MTLPNEFAVDVQALRDRARKHIEEGAVTDDYSANLKTAIRVLNEALATELICVLRYKSHAANVVGINSGAVRDEFLEHAQDEADHADMIAKRISELGGKADYNPKTLLARSHSEYVEGKDLVDMIKEDLVAERIAIESYREMIRYFGDRDPTSRALMETILAKEEEHAAELHDLLIAQDASAMLTH